MPWHDWGSDFNFRRLGDAGRHLGKLYERITKKHMMWKEKYGTIRYEFLFLWITTDEEAIIFDKCLRHCIKRFPDVAGELADDAVYSFTNPEWEGFYKGVVHLHDALNKENACDQF